MLKPRSAQVTAGTTPNYSDDSVRIEAGSIVVDNSWVNYDAVLFRLSEYIGRAVVPPRTRFFQNRNYAVYLMVGLDLDEGIKVVEGRQVPFTSVRSVPRPVSFDIVPLIGIVAVQNGSDDLNLGYLPLRNENIEYFNGAGNVLDAGRKGITGVDSDVAGETGPQGMTGPEGSRGALGASGISGYTGLQPIARCGETGVRGMTGINWQVHVPLISFFQATE